MSDDGDDFMQDSEQEEYVVTYLHRQQTELTWNPSYDFEYEDDDDEEEDGDIDIENKYYQAKQVKTERPEDAIAEFLGVPQLEPEKGDWCAIHTMEFSLQC